jgi:hypothetical protein
VIFALSSLETGQFALAAFDPGITRPSVEPKYLIFQLLRGRPLQLSA